MAVALVVAAGRGERLGSDGPKALVVLAGRPMLEWSIDALRAVPAIQQIVVALPAGVVAPAGTLGVPGGQERSHSVRAALHAARPDDAVVVHDAARPLLTPAIVEECLAELARGRCDAAIAAAPVTDTIKRTADGDRVEETLDRAGLWAVQTPQAFRADALRGALSDADSLPDATDDAMLVERQGGRVLIHSAPAENLKVTAPIDLRVAELLLRERA